jgi:hypothetical protein
LDRGLVMVRRTQGRGAVVWQRTVVVLSALTAPGCFNVTKVDPGDGGPCTSFLIDNFEDGDDVPSTELLGRWECYTYNPDTQPVTCGIGPGIDGGMGLFAQFNLQDPPNDMNDNGGAALSTFTTGAPLDLRPYRDLVISAQIIQGAPPLPTQNLNVSVELGCADTAPLVDPGLVGYVDVAQGLKLDFNAPWATFHLPMSGFEQPEWETSRFAGGAAECLARVENFAVTVTPNLTDGQAGSGTLRIDNIQFEGTCAP